MPTQAQLLRSVAHKGTDGDTELAHVSKGDVVVPVEMQVNPVISAGLRALFTAANVNKKSFTVGTGKRNYKTGLQSFALGQPLGPDDARYKAAALGEIGLAPSIATSRPGVIASPSALASSAAASSVPGTSNRGDILANQEAAPSVFGGPSISDLVRQVGAGDQGGPGNPSGGQPGSAGTGSGKTAADTLMGLAMGLGPLGVAGSIMGKIGSMAANPSLNPLDPNFSPFDVSALFGPSPAQPLGPMAQNIDINPAAYADSANLAPGDLSKASQTIGSAINATQNERGLSTDPGTNTGIDSGNSGIGGAPGNTGGVASGGSIGVAGGAGMAGIAGGGGVSIGGGGTSTGAGGEGTGATGDHGSTGDGTGAAGGLTAKGGPIKGPKPAHPDHDNLKIEETGQGLQAGEYVLNKQAKTTLGENNLKALNDAARKGNKDAIKESLLRMMLQSMSTKKAA